MKTHEQHERQPFMRRTMVGLGLASAAVMGTGLAACTYEQPSSAVSVRTYDSPGNGGNPEAPHYLQPSPLDLTPSAVNSATIERLRYLIEEEKFAHDVYKTLGDIWGTRIFEMIEHSESTHEDAVHSLLESRGIDDPRSDEIGVFSNGDLQALYNRLVAQGSRSLADAYLVGVAIEQLDINDLTTYLASSTPLDTDIRTVLEHLLSGSESHLAAFEQHT